MAELYNPDYNKPKEAGVTFSSFDDRELKPKEELVKDLLTPIKYESVLGEGLTSRRTYQEKLQDRINIRNSIIYASARKELNDTDSMFEQALNKAKSLYGGGFLESIPEENREEYLKELEKANQEELDMLKVVSKSYQVALNNSGFLKRNIYAPSYSAIIDTLNPTDLGDITSIARVGTFFYSAPKGIAAAVTQGFTKKALTGAVTAAAVEGALEAPLDVLRDKSEGYDITVGRYLKHATINTATNLAFTGLGYTAGKAFESFKSRFAKAMTKAATETVGEEAQGTVTQAVKEGIDINSGRVGKGEELVSSTNLEDGVVKQVADVEDNISNGVKIGDTTAAEQIQLENIGKKKIKNWDKLDPQEKINLARKNGLLEEAKLEAKRKAKNTLEIKTKAIFNIARTFTTNLEKIRDATGESLDKLIDKQLVAHGPAIMQGVEFLMQPFRLAEKKAIIKINSKIETLSGGTLKNTAELYDKIVKNGNNIIESLYTGKIKNVGDLTKGEYEAFEYISNSLREKVMKTKSEIRLTKDDYLFRELEKRGLVDDYLDIYDPTGDFSRILVDDVTYTLKPDINKIEVMLSEFGFDDIVAPTSELREWAENGVLDFIRGKKTLKALESEYNDFVKSGNVSLEEGTLEKIKQFIKDNREELKFKNELAKTFRKSEAIERSQFAKVFRYYNKRDLLQDLSLVSTRNLEGGGSSTAEKFYKTKEEAVEALGPERAKILEQRLNDFEEATGKYNARIEDEFYGADFGGYRYDLRTTTTSEAYAKLTGKSKKDWDKLSPEEKIEFINNNLGYNLTQKQSKKVGRAVAERVGSDDLQEVFDFYKKTLELPDDYQLVFNSEGKFFSVRGQNVISIDPSLDRDTLLGVLRHELQHAYENYHTGKLEDFDFLENIFRNKPEIQGEVLEKIKAGKDVTLDEVIGSFYGNHFYNIQTDSFENSYLAHKAAQEYNKLDTFKKYQFFLSAMSDTTQAKSVGKLKDTWVLQIEDKDTDLKEFIKNSLKDTQQSYEFFSRRFNSPNSIIKFLNTVGNNVDRYVSLATSLQRATRDEEVGYSLSQLFRSLNLENMKKQLTKEGVDSKYLDTTVQKFIATIAEGIRSSSIKLEYIDDKSVGNVVVGLFARKLVGFRAFKDVYFSSANQGLQYIFNGEYKKGVAHILKDIPRGTVALGKSFAHTTGELVDDVDQWINVGVKKIAGIDLEPRFLAHFAEGLRHFGEVGEGYDKLDVLRRVSEAQVDMANISEQGLDRNSFGAAFLKSNNRAMRGLQADDIRSSVMATRMSQLEIDTMLKKSSFSELTPVQKTIYNYSGFSHEEFAEFKVDLEKELEIFKNKNVSIYDIPNALPRFKSMIDGGRAIFNPNDRAKQYAKGQAKNPFMFMIGVTTRLAKDCWTLINARNVDGVLMYDNSLDNIFRNVTPMLASAVVAGTAAYGTTSVLFDSLKQRENPLKVMQSDLDDLKEAVKDKNPISIGFNPIFQSLIQGAPIGMLLSGQKGRPAIYSLIDTTSKAYRKGELPSYLCSFYYGAMVNKALQIFNGDEKKAGKYIKSKKFRDQYSQVIDKRLYKDMNTIVNSYTQNYVNDARTALKSKQITLDEYNRITDSVLLK